MGGTNAAASGLTRALMLGATVAAGGIVPVGCATLTGITGTQSQPSGSAVVAATASEDELCGAALSSRSARDVEALLRAHPAASCIPATLDVMPTATLAAISPVVLGTMSGSTRSQLSPRVERELRFPFEAGGGGSSSASGGGGSSGGGGGPY
jgi:hypothetical protein